MTGALPLAGLKVLDLTRARAGPVAVRQLADWGADVLMIEVPGGADDMLGSRESGDFQNLHRNKRSLALNLKSKVGREILLKLACDADVLVENYRPDVKQRLGIGYDDLSALNPRLVYASISGFGQTGPYALRPGVDQIAQGLGGLMSVTGQPGEGPMRTGIAVTDVSAGLLCAIGVLTALYERVQTGKGRWVRTSLLQAAVTMLDFQAARWLVDGVVPGQEGNHHPSVAPMGLFETRDGHVNLAAAGQDLFGKFALLVQRHDWLQDARFASSAQRFAHREELRAEVNAALSQRTSGEWVELCNAAGIPCGPVHAINEMFADPQVRHLQLTQAVRSEAYGELELVKPGIDFADAEFAPRRAAPAAGEHTDEVLRGLGYEAGQIEALRENGVI